MKQKLADKEDKFSKVVKTAKSLKAKLESLKIEKEEVSKELELAKGNISSSLELFKKFF